MDKDGDGLIKASDIYEMASELEMDEAEADEFLENVMWMDEDEDGAVT